MSRGPEKWYGNLHWEPYHLKKWYGFGRVCRIGSGANGHSAPVCEIFANRTDYSKNMTSCRFSRWRISAMLDFRGPVMGSLKSQCTTSYRSSVRTIALNYLVFFEEIVFFTFWRQTERTDEQMDSPDAWSRSRYRERRLNNVSDIKIDVIPSSKIGFVTAITITVTLSCSLLGKSRCLATVAKIFTFWNGTTPENVKHVIVGICVKFHAFITIWAIFAPYAWTIPKIQRRSEDRELNHVSNQTKTWYAFMKLRRSCGATAPPGDVYIAQCCYRCRREGVRKEQET